MDMMLHREEELSEVPWDENNPPPAYEGGESSSSSSQPPRYASPAMHPQTVLMD